MKYAFLQGKLLIGLPVTPTVAVGFTTLNGLRDFGIKEPLAMARTSERRLDTSDVPNKRLRVLVQRTWDNARKRNAHKYKEYLRLMYSGKPGSAPPVTLYVPQAALPNDDEDNVLRFPYDESGVVTAIAIDGETQLQARFFLAQENPATASYHFPITIHHGIDEDHAIQILHDYNRYGTRISEKVLGSRNTTGGLSNTIAEALEIASLDIGELNRIGTAGTKKFVASYQQSMAFVAAYAVGQEALKRSVMSWFNDLNEPGSAPINRNCRQMLAAMYDLARSNMKVRQAGPAIWQVAGVLASEDRHPKALNWDKGLESYAETARAGKFGKVKTADRLAALYTSLKI